MARLNGDNETIAAEIISRYPVKKSALIPLLHLAQEQDGCVTDDAMVHIARLVDVTPAEVVGTCTFYEMLKRHRVGTYHVNVCDGISCHLSGSGELLHHAEEALGIKAGNTTGDGLFTLEGVECIAACTEAPCLQVNYRYENKVTLAGFDTLIDDLRNGERRHIPPHGTLAKTRQQIPDERRAGAVAPDRGERPEWLERDGEGESA